MKTTIFAILALLFLSSGSICAQGRLLDFNSPPKDTLDYSKVRCIYEQSSLKDTISRTYSKEEMLLQIGSKVSKYVSYVSFRTDSLVADDLKKKNNINLVEAAQSGRYKIGTNFINLFKNFPLNKFTIGNRIAYDNYLYEENFIVPKWKIEKENETILGYSCTKATTTFHGRNYIAWFTPDIPISEGPWKFTGLPGLIMKIYDDKKEKIFECIQVENVSWSDPILKTKIGRSTVKTTKENFYKQLRQFHDNPSAFINNNSRVTTNAPRRVQAKIWYNPIELSL